MVVGESSQSLVKDTTLTFQCLILTSTNYTIWRMRIEVLLRIHGVWDVVDPGSDDARKNNIVKGLLFQSILEDLVLQIGNFKTGKEMWEAIKTHNSGADRVNEERLQTLITEFENLKMLDNETIDAYAAKLSGLNIPTGIMTQAEDVAQTLEVIDEVEVKDVIGATLKTKTQEKDVYPEEGTFFMMNHIQEMIFMNEEKYTPPKSESNIDDEDDVWFGDGSCVSINGKGSILFQGKNGEQKLLKDVYYIPALRSNVISLGQATISGYDISIRAEKGWKIHHLDVKKAFLNGDRKKLDGTLKEIGFLQCVHEKVVYRKVPNGEFIIVVVYGDDLFMTRTSLDLINEFKKRMASQFEMSDLGELSYYLGIEVSQGKDCVEIKQERYAMKILKEAGMEDCITTLRPMEPGLKLSKAEDEPEFEATQYQKMVGCLRYLFHTHPHSTYSLGVVSRFMQSPRISHDHAINQILRYLKVLLDTFFYLGTSPITWCSQKQTIVALSSCEAEFMAATAAACQSIWLRKILAEVKENDQVIVEHVSGENQRAAPLTKALARIRYVVFLMHIHLITTIGIESFVDSWRIVAALRVTISVRFIRSLKTYVGGTRSSSDLRSSIYSSINELETVHWAVDYLVKVENLVGFIWEIVDRMRMEVLLEINRVWDVVDPGSDNAKKNNIVKGLLFQSIPKDLVLQIRN
ncbi:uncharacterized mitochondrial protein-like protein [Tanacetum coccineum]